MDVANRQVVVVGATGTIGGAVRRDLASAGAFVLGTGRGGDQLAQLRGSGIRAVPLDLTPCHTAAREFREACLAAFPHHLDGLVLAGGAHGPIGPTLVIDATDLSDHLNQHLMSTVALIGAVALLLDKSPAPSIVLLSGGGATGPRANYTPYAMAKVAAVRLAENLAVEEPHWRVNAVAPGFVASRIHDSSIAAGKGRSGEDPDQLRERLAHADSPDRAAGLIRLLLSDASTGITGRLISAVWDPWEDPAWADKLRRDESLARLRRIDGVQFGGMETD